MAAEHFAATSYRGAHIENRHLAHVAVTDAQGKLLYHWGDPQRMTLIRSAAKPAQALAVLETSATLARQFEAADLALMCASHNAETAHLERARAMLIKFNLAESDLCCGGHPSLSDAVNREWMQRNLIPGPLCSNCSGKHIGMAAAAAELAGASDGYAQPDHPLQRRIRSTLAELVDLPIDAIGWAIDGCNAPTPALPLERLALLYARFAAAVDTVNHVDASPPDERTLKLAALYSAMAIHPDLVAGSHRFCTALMQSFDGELIGKIGADGCYAVGIRADAVRHLLSANRGSIGIAVKVEDGNIAIVHAVVCEVLRQLLRSLPAELASFHAPAMLNTAGISVGRLELGFALSSTHPVL